MADDDKPEQKPAPKDDPKGELGDSGKRALDAERQSRRDAEKALKEANDRLKALEDKDKSETQKAVDDMTTAQRRAEKAEAELLRITVGIEKGLTPAQARRLVGATKEELESDADDLLSSFGPANGGDKGDKGGDGGEGDGRGDGKGGVPARPKEDLRGGGDPTEEPAVDMRKVVESIPRNF